MDLSAYKAISIGGIAMKKLTLDGVQIWKSGPTNWVRKSINADGSIYNNGLGYKDGYRIRSGGAEGSAPKAACTGFIPVQGGNIVRISGCTFDYKGTENAINVSDGSFANIGQACASGQYGIFTAGGGYSAYAYSSVVKESEGVWKWVVPPAASGVAYIRVTGYNDNGGNGAALIVTINEEIT